MLRLLLWLWLLLDLIFSMSVIQVFLRSFVFEDLLLFSLFRFWLRLRCLLVFFFIFTLFH